MFVHASRSEPAVAPYSTFSPTLRTHLTYFLGLTVTLSTLTTTIYFPLIPTLSKQFSTSVQSINLTVTAYAVAQALSPALFASLADFYGRRPVLLGLIATYAVASLGLALNRTSSYAALLVLRILQSVGGSPTPAIAYGIVADLVPVAGRGSMLGPLLSTCNALSAVGPVVGGVIALKTTGVQWVFVALLLVSIFFFLLAGFTLPETGRGVVGNGDIEAHGIWRTWWSYLRLLIPERQQYHLDHEKRRRSSVSEGCPEPRAKWALEMLLCPSGSFSARMLLPSYGWLPRRTRSTTPSKSPFP